MGRLRSVASQSPAIAIRIIALVFALGASACAAAHVGGSQAGTGSTAIRAGHHSTSAAGSTSITWHRLHLINGWMAVKHSAGVYGFPSFAVRNGVLYLSGILQAPRPRPGGGSPEFARLPKSARPEHFLWISYANFGGGNVGLMEIEPSGSMSVYAPNNGRAVNPSLAAISFPLSS